MKTLTDLLTTPGPLRLWLESQPEGTVVGKAVSLDDCPVFCFFRAHEVPISWVTAPRIGLVGGRRQDNPDWLMMFVHLIDSAVINGHQPPEVTREFALRVLVAAAAVAP